MISSFFILPVFPVYAGVILGVFAVCADDFCVPRVCGGDPDKSALVESVSVSVPRVCGGDPN